MQVSRKALIAALGAGALTLAMCYSVQAEGLPDRYRSYSQVPEAWKSYGYGYLGLTAGYGAANFEALSEVETVIDDDESLEGGVYLGYLWRASKVLGLGVEADYVRTNVKGDVDGDEDFDIKSQYSASARGRAGIFLGDPFFVYGTGGWAWSDTGDGPVYGGGLDVTLTERVVARVEVLRYELGDGEQDRTVARAGLAIKTN